MRLCAPGTNEMLRPRLAGAPVSACPGVGCNCIIPVVPSGPKGDIVEATHSGDAPHGRSRPRRAGTVALLVKNFKLSRRSPLSRLRAKHAARPGRSLSSARHSSLSPALSNLRPASSLRYPFVQRLSRVRAAFRSLAAIISSMDGDFAGIRAAMKY
jgi:hypothetical protein